MKIMILAYLLFISFIIELIITIKYRNKNVDKYQSDYLTYTS